MSHILWLLKENYAKKIFILLVQDWSKTEKVKIMEKNRENEIKGRKSWSKQ